MSFVATNGATPREPSSVGRIAKTTSRGAFAPELRRENDMPEKLTIQRHKWFRGRGSEHSRLLRHDGRMCCLGFYSLQCGLQPEHILGCGLPSNAKTFDDPLPLPQPMQWLDRCELRIAGINDDEDITEEEREQELTESFKKYGNVEVEFVD